MPTAIARPPPSTMTSLSVFSTARGRVDSAYLTRSDPLTLSGRSCPASSGGAVQQEEHSHPQGTVSLSRSASQATTHCVTGGAIGESARRGDRYRARLGQYRIDR